MQMKASEEIHMARVFIAQARSRRHQSAFHATLLQWAANARKRAMQAMKTEQSKQLALC